MISEIFEDSFKYTFKDKKTFIKLGILSLFSFLIVPIFVLFGYSYRVVSIGLQGIMINSKDPLPKMDNITTLLKEGLKIFLVMLVYSIPSIIISTLVFSNTGLFNIMGSCSSSFMITLNTGTIYILLLLVVWFVSFLFISVAIPHMIENKGFLKSAFKIKELIEVIKFFGVLKFVELYIITLVLIILLPIILFFISQGIINIISFLLPLVQISISNAVVSILNIIVFLILVLLIIFPFFTIFQSRFISFMYDPS